jgi:LPXTG-motif cell wall-anchored protein
VKKKFKHIMSLIILLSAAVVTPAFQVMAESEGFSDSQQLEQDEKIATPSNDTNDLTEADNATMTTMTSSSMDAKNEQTQVNSDNEKNISESDIKEDSAVSTVDKVPSSVNASAARAVNGQPIQGAYFTLTSSTSGEVTLLVTDSSGKVTIQLPSGGYFIKQVGTTNQRQNYAFTSVGNSITLQPGETKTLELYERLITGEYAFGNSPDTIHIPVNSTFDFSTKTIGIEAFKLNFSGNIEKSISDSQIYPYYTNVDPSNPGSYSVNTTHVVNVIVDPEQIGEVNVRYLDGQGQEIHEMQTLTGTIGEPYDVSNEEYKLTIDGYTLDETKLPENSKGILGETAQTVTYLYTKNPVPAADVTVEYVNTEGKEVHPSQTISGNVGDPYDASTEQYQLKIEGYTLDETKLPENGIGVFGETAQTVTYVYTKNAVPAADITVEYIDTEGNEIHASQTISGNVGNPYDASTENYQLTIDGYTLDESQLPENTTGVFGETVQTVTYVYTKNPVPAADVTIEYVDKEGNEIHASQTISGNVGESYDASVEKYQLKIEGYTLDETKLPENGIGVFSETAQTVTYIYIKNPMPAADITVKYVDTEGNEIHDSQTISGSIGDSYDASTHQYKVTIEGYTLDETQLPENSKGIFSETAETVAYIYIKNPVPAADVTVEYVDTEGKEIHSSQAISGNVGDPYDASTEKYQLIIDGYTLDQSQLPENNKGVFEETAQTVTYIYTKNPLSAADVTVEYVDTEGKEIHPPQIITGNVGDSYDASTEKYQLTIDGYILDGSQLPQNAKGTFGKQEATVTYVYTKENVATVDSSDKKEKDPTATVTSKKSNSAQRLPQTDEQGTLFPFVVGLCFVTTASWLYFRKRK